MHWFVTERLVKERIFWLSPGYTPILSFPVHDPVEELYVIVTASACDKHASLVIPDNVTSGILSVPATRETEDTTGDPGHTLAVHEMDTPVVERFCMGTAVNIGNVTKILLVLIVAIGVAGGWKAPTTPLVGISVAKAILTGESAVSRKSGDTGGVDEEAALTNAGGLTLTTLPVFTRSPGSPVLS